ncbi:uncharacterized protein LOC119104313 [Pollicipes pollicipes]|uniref:uncharacterized protein LOC119104313 n=1 Tax=Pollicipes pollicipes TaxID=41117 RepID=UPI0018859F21|nr:uncharacterized protein LOC119104313 [Pollicipes pollicipes]
MQRFVAALLLVVTVRALPQDIERDSGGYDMTGTGYSGSSYDSDPELEQYFTADVTNSIEMLRSGSVLLPLLSSTADLLWAGEESSCQQYRLCQLGQLARRSGPPYSVAVPLASLPLSWIKSKFQGSRITDLCWTMASMGRTTDCSTMYKSC